ncbi:hypothetical protein D3C72_2335380 [compost metagenome]
MFVPGGDVKAFQIEIERVAPAAAAQIQRFAGFYALHGFDHLGMGARQLVLFVVVIFR